MSSVYFGLCGLGGFAREVMPWAVDIIGQTLESDAVIPLFVGPENCDEEEVEGYRCVSENEFQRLEGRRFFNVAIADSKVRMDIVRRMSAFAQPVTLIARDARLLGRNTIGVGAIICPFAIVTSNAVVGDFFHANLYSYVAHGCVLGDFVTFAPAVKCNGNCRIGDHVYIGTGAIIRDGTSEKPTIIGERAVVGMGAVVTKDVAERCVVVGNPARRFR